jgi:hypothetical protein
MKNIIFQAAYSISKNVFVGGFCLGGLEILVFNIIHLIIFWIHLSYNFNLLVILALDVVSLLMIVAKQTIVDNLNLRTESIIL